jgi:hypothetical protein
MEYIDIPEYIEGLNRGMAIGVTSKSTRSKPWILQNDLKKC